MPHVRRHAYVGEAEAPLDPHRDEVLRDARRTSAQGLVRLFDEHRIGGAGAEELGRVVEVRRHVAGDRSFGTGGVDARHLRSRTPVVAERLPRARHLVERPGSAHDREPDDPVRAAERGGGRERPTARPADDREPIEAQVVGELLDVASGVGETPPRLRIGPAVPRGVERDQPDRARRRRPERPRAGRAVQADDGRAASLILVREHPAVGEPERRAHSCTSSISVPKAVFGWTNATVVPRLPGRGCSSITRCPLRFTDSSASAQSATR